MKKFFILATIAVAIASMSAAKSMNVIKGGVMPDLIPAPLVSHNVDAEPSEQDIKDIIMECKAMAITSDYTSDVEKARQNERLIQKMDKANIKVNENDRKIKTCELVIEELMSYTKIDEQSLYEQAKAEGNLSIMVDIIDNKLFKYDEFGDIVMENDNWTAYLENVKQIKF